MRGNLGNDQLYGEADGDDLRGGGSKDALDGGAGDDFLYGDRGRDTVNGGTGNDRLSGGEGGGIGDGFADVFVFGNAASNGGGTDRILDFENGLDTIDLRAFGFTDFNADLLPLVSERAWGLRIDFGSGDVLEVMNMTLALFDASDVILS